MSDSPADLLVESVDAEHLAQHEPGVVEAERLVEVADEQVLLHGDVLASGRYRKTRNRLFVNWGSMETGEGSDMWL